MIKVYGSAALQTSVAEAEIVPTISGWENSGLAFKTFELLNKEICHISINGSGDIYLAAGQGVKFSFGDGTVKSVKITEDNITFNWIGTI